MTDIRQGADHLHTGYEEGVGTKLPGYSKKRGGKSEPVLMTDICQCADHLQAGTDESVLVYLNILRREVARASLS